MGLGYAWNNRYIFGNSIWSCYLPVLVSKRKIAESLIGKRKTLPLLRSDLVLTSILSSLDGNF